MMTCRDVRQNIIQTTGFLGALSTLCGMICLLSPPPPHKSTNNSKTYYVTFRTWWMTFQFNLIIILITFKIIHHHHCNIQCFSNQCQVGMQQCKQLDLLYLESAIDLQYHYRCLYFLLYKCSKYMYLCKILHIQYVSLKTTYTWLILISARTQDLQTSAVGKGMKALNILCNLTWIPQNLAQNVFYWISSTAHIY